MNLDILFGKTTDHLVPLEGTKFLVHKEMVQDFLNLQRSALKADLDLRIVSAFRDYERQKKIWNAKARGERPLFGERGEILEHASLSPVEIMFAILRWSAIPGCSRHHWGCDLDVFDGKTQSEEEVRLVPEECVGDGPASKLHDWLDSLIAENSSYGFYRPYLIDRGGIAPERWHLSYYPVSKKILEKYDYSLFKKNIENSDLLLKEELLAHSDEIFQRFFTNIDQP